MINKHLFPILLFISLFACSGEELTSNIVVYSNNFESNDLSDITGGRIITYLGSNVIGNYNNDGFRLHLNDLPDHDYIYVSFDLLLHDSWDGNFNGFDPDVPDLWVMELDPGLNSGANEFKFETTFSNGPCDSALCLWQSFPNSYPFSAKPRSAVSWKGRGLCSSFDNNQGTSVVRIEQTYRRTGQALVITFYDKLFQPNRVDGKCDESWSMDNLVVRALSTE